MSAVLTAAPTAATIAPGRQYHDDNPRVPQVMRKPPLRLRIKHRHPLLTPAMWLLAAAVGLPLYYIVVNTLRTPMETLQNPLGLPSSIYLENYIRVFRDLPIFRSFLNTLYVTTIAVVLQVIVGATAAYAMIIRTSRVTKIIGGILLVAFVIPGQSTMLPIYLMIVDLGMVNTHNGLIMMYLGGSIFCWFLIRGYMRTIPYELIEAALIDGAGTWQIFWRIVLPLIRPILITVGVFQTMWVWNDFILANLVLSSPTQRTLVLQVANAIGQFSTDWPMFMTITVIVLVPMVIFFIFAQKHIVSGLLAGSVKG